MRPGHREAQEMFQAIGSKLGYQARRVWTRERPTDGVWLIRDVSPAIGGLPVAAVEVVVSESKKSLGGSVATLEAVSPALGVVLLQGEEIRRQMITHGASDEDVNRRINSIRSAFADLSRSSRQRLELWTFDQLRRLHSHYCIPSRVVRAI